MIDEVDIDERINHLRKQKQIELVNKALPVSNKRIGISALLGQKSPQSIVEDQKQAVVKKLPTNISTIHFKLKQEPHLTIQPTYEQLPLKENTQDILVKQLKHKHQTGDAQPIQNQQTHIQVTNGVTLSSKIGGVQRQIPTYQNENGTKKYSLAEYKAMREKEGGLQINKPQLNQFRRIVTDNQMTEDKDTYSDIFDSSNTLVPLSAQSHVQPSINYTRTQPRKSETESIHKVSSLGSLNLLMGPHHQTYQSTAITSFVPTRKNQQQYFNARGQSIDHYQDQQTQLNTYILQQTSGQSSSSNRNINAQAKRTTPLILSATNNLTSTYQKKLVSNRIRK